MLEWLEEQDAARLVASFLTFAELQALSSASRWLWASSLRTSMLARALVSLPMRDCEYPPAITNSTLLDDVKHVVIKNAFLVPTDTLRGRLRALHSVRFVNMKRPADYVSQWEAEDCETARCLDPPWAHRVHFWINLFPPTVDSVDLGELHINSLPSRWPALKTLTRWRDEFALLADKYMPDDAGLLVEHLQFRNYGERKMSDGRDWMAHRARLRVLTLHNTSVRSVEWLTSLQCLEELTIVHATGIHDLSPLFAAKALRRLQLGLFGHHRYVDIHPSSGRELSQLVVLSLRGVPVRNYDFFAQCPNIDQLTLQGTTVRSWHALSHLQKLRKLDIRIDLIDSWSPLSSLPRLQHLTLRGKRAKINGQHLPKMLALTHLVVPPMSKLARLKTVTPRLHSLTIQKWTEVTFKALADLRGVASLRELTVEGVELKMEREYRMDARDLKALTQLRYLHLWDMPVETAHFIESLTQLEGLEVSLSYSNSLPYAEWFDPLFHVDHLPELRELKLRHSRCITDDVVPFLLRLPKLKVLDITGCRLRESKDQLRNCGISVIGLDAQYVAPPPFNSDHIEDVWDDEGNFYGGHAFSDEE